MKTIDASIFQDVDNFTARYFLRIKFRR